jgi:hypothetical protein
MMVLESSGYIGRPCVDGLRRQLYRFFPRVFHQHQGPFQRCHPCLPHAVEHCRSCPVRTQWLKQMGRGKLRDGIQRAQAGASRRLVGGDEAVAVEIPKGDLGIRCQRGQEEEWGIGREQPER